MFNEDEEHPKKLQISHHQVCILPSSHSSTCGAREHLLLLGIIDAVREMKETVVKLELIKTLVMDGKVVHFKLHRVLGMDEIA